MIKQLKALNACPEALRWLEGKTQQKAWDTCTQADWMIWLSMKKAGSPGWSSWQDVILVICDLVEPSLSPGDDRQQEAIAAARGLVAGTVPEARVRDAATRAAYASAYAGADVAAAAAYANANAAAANAAAYAGADVAYAAAYAGAAITNATTNAADGQGLSLAEMADMIRSRLTICSL